MEAGKTDERDREVAFSVPSASGGERLDVFLAGMVPGTSRSRIKRLIETGEALVDGRKARPAARVRTGSSVSVRVPATEPLEPEPEDIPIEILFEDGHLIVVNKPAGMSCHPTTAERTRTLVNALLFHAEALPRAGDRDRPGIVHRLDKGTSGVMVAAKTGEALHQLALQFKRRLVRKTYLAIVLGDPGERGKFSTLYGRHPTMRLRFSSKVREGKEAVTAWRRLDRFDEAALVEVMPVTGRSHQIRVHFSDNGNPLLGDTLYVSSRRWRRLLLDDRLREAVIALGRQALHSFSIEFSHPADGRLMRFSAEPPPDFSSLLSLLREAGASG